MDAHQPHPPAPAPENTVLIGRVRKDTKLYAPCQEQPGKNGRPRKYGATVSTPEQLRTDDTVAWRRMSAFATEKRHDLRSKRMARSCPYHWRGQW